MRRLIVSVLVAMTAVVTWSVAAPTPAFAAGETWTGRSMPQSAWRAVAGKGGSAIYVAVADGGVDRIMRSTNDGVSWAAVDAPVVNTWTSVTYGDGTDPYFVAVASDDGSSRAMRSTDDGATWTAYTTPASTWRSVAYDVDNGQFLAVASSGTNRVMVSPQGTAWTADPDDVADAGTWRSVVYGPDDDTYVAVGDDGDIMFSTDAGASWDAADSPTGQTTNDWTSVTYDGGRFVAVSSNGADRAMYSGDGISWTASDDDNDTDNGAWTSVTWNGTRLVAVGSGANRVMTSDDGGDDWDLETATNAPWAAVGTNGVDLVAVANNGTLRTMNSGDDGDTWTDHLAAANVWTSVTYGNGLFVAVADTGSTNRVMTSPDGVNWTLRAATARNLWFSVTYGNGTFVAVSGDGFPNQVMTSTDGITWTPQIAAADLNWLSVTYGEGLFVAVAANPSGLMTSPDGENWTLNAQLVTSAHDWKAVAYGGSSFVAVDRSGSGKAMSSPDGLTWTERSTPASQAANPWQAVAYGGGLFAAVSSAGTDRAMTSTAGTTWAASGDPTATDDGLWNGITYGDGTFVAVGAPDVSSNRVMTSTDGADWTARAGVAGSTWAAVTFHGGMFVAVAADGTTRIMTSGSLAVVPTITSFTPTEGPVGTVVTITGTNFVSGATTVLLDGVEVPSGNVTVVSPTQLTVEIPEGATSGAFTVTTAGGSDVSDDDFTVTVVSDSIRIWGQDEIDTAIEIAQFSFPNIETTSADVDAAATDADAVVLARNDFFADALAGGPLAAEVNGPLLLTYGAPTANGNILPERVRDEIDRLINPGEVVYVLGGPLAISADVVNDLDDAGYTVVRLGGANQFGTAVKIADEIGDPGAIFEATGWNFPDALSAVPAAIKTGGVIVLTNNNVQAPETQAYIDQHPNVTRYTIGGDLVAGGADQGATNVSGPDLYGTSAAVATRFFPNPDEFGVATGNTFPDALAGGVFMATGGRMGPMLLVNGSTTPVPSAIKTYLNNLEPGTFGYFFGGTLAISTSVLNAVMAAVGA